MSIVRVLLLFAILCFFGDASAEELPKTVNLSAIENEQTHEAAGEILIEAYNRLGITVSIDQFPAKRSLNEANIGNTDGDVARIPGTENKFPNLIPVPTPIIHFKGVAFTKSVKRPINTWSDLSNYRIGIIRGVRYSEINTKDMNRILASDMTHLFLLLMKGRIQFAVAVQEAGLAEIQNNYPDSGMHIVGDPLFSSPLHHFVHKKIAHLIPKLDAVLKDMEQSGRLEEIYQSTFR